MRTKLFLVTARGRAPRGDGAALPARQRPRQDPLLVPRPADRDARRTAASRSPSQGGNRPALRAMLGAPVTQTFAYGAHDRVPEVVEGHPDRRQRRRPRRRRLRLGARPRAARRDRSPRSSSRPPASSATTARSSSSPTSRCISSAARSPRSALGTVTVHVTGGNRRALQPADRLVGRPVVHLRRRARSSCSGRARSRP